MHIYKQLLIKNQLDTIIRCHTSCCLYGTIFCVFRFDQNHPRWNTKEY